MLAPVVAGPAVVAGAALRLAAGAPGRLAA
jgi:hypothetical protein